MHENNIKKEERNLNLDILRSVACFMVIFLHVSAQYYHSNSIYSFNWNIYNFYDSCVRSSVPLFIMISGVFFLMPQREITTKKLYLKHVLKLVIIYLVWSTIYTIYNIYTKACIINTKSIIASIIQGPYHFWYIPMIIVLYIISPILKKITKEIDKSTIRYFVIVFIISCIVKTISDLSILPFYNGIKLICNIIPIEIICQYYSYFLLGYFLYYIDISELQKKIIYIFGFASPIVCTILTFYLSKNVQSANPVLYDNFSIFTLFEAISIFLFFKNRKYENKKITKKVICELSKCTLGIYLMHILLINVITSKIDLSNYNALLMVPLISIIIFMFSFIITFILRKIRIIRKLV